MAAEKPKTIGDFIFKSELSLVQLRALNEALDLGIQNADTLQQNDLETQLITRLNGIYKIFKKKSVNTFEWESDFPVYVTMANFFIFTIWGLFKVTAWGPHLPDRRIRQFLIAANALSIVIGIMPMTYYQIRKLVHHWIQLPRLRQFVEEGIRRVREIQQ